MIKRKKGNLDETQKEVKRRYCKRNGMEKLYKSRLLGRKYKIKMSNKRLMKLMRLITRDNKKKT
jgi:chorismate-pyruvate lyase